MVITPDGFVLIGQDDDDTASLICLGGSEPPRSDNVDPSKAYHNAPLTTFVNAVMPIVRKKLADNVVRNAKKAYADTPDNPSDSLTKGESAAIRLYTKEGKNSRSVYHMLNKALDRNTEAELKPWYLYLRLICTGLKKIPSWKDSVYRGVSEDLRDQYGKTAESGKMYTWYRITSCTKRLESAEKFLNKNTKRDSYCTLFHIRGYSGVAISGHSDYQNENEVTFLPGTKFVFESSIVMSNMLLVELREENYAHVSARTWVQSAKASSLEKRLKAQEIQSRAQTAQIKSKNATIETLTKLVQTTTAEKDAELKRKTAELISKDAKIETLTKQVQKPLPLSVPSPRPAVHHCSPSPGPPNQPHHHRYDDFSPPRSPRRRHDDRYDYDNRYDDRYDDRYDYDNRYDDFSPRRPPRRRYDDFLPPRRRYDD
ncbi:unnamed protein product [Didymodactylos carnosus]|uniref:NAD(P)(+)--arginine ADP-ribosyltransferase n=1 Tax=Didymodactylos carnosus TaxID=1234261 RepID=A0A8S2KK02_9BILA|nr:unnamed protein product [Didymodactylos carnosus]CAF3858590.1 unnamed protein product [Didymodactylos carnosus]